MDNRPRRSAANVNYNLLDRQYDEQFKAEMQARRRSSSGDKDLRKRKRESDSPRAIQHTALREGLRNSVSSATMNEYTMHDAHTDTYSHRYHRKRDSTDDDDSRRINGNGHIVKLQINKSGNTNGIQHEADHNDRERPQRHLRRSSRTDARYDEPDIMNESEPFASPEQGLIIGQKYETDDESEEQYHPRKSSRRSKPIVEDESESEGPRHRARRDANVANKPSKSSRSRKAPSGSDEDEYVDESAEDDELLSEGSLMSDRDDLHDFIEDDEDSRRSRRPKTASRVSRRASRQPKQVRRTNRFIASDDEDFSGGSSPLDLQAELAELRPAREERRRELRDRTNRPDYSIPPPLTDQDQAILTSAPTRNRNINVRSSFRSLYPEYGALGLGLGTDKEHKFGNFGPPVGIQSDSDSSDDEGQTAKTTAKAVAGALLPAMKSLDQSGGGGGPSNLGKIKGSQLADADPIGIDKNVNFDSVGGLEDHIDQLKEMVSLPLLYPEIFQRFHITPPRGVLFHGPPGTGKTLMARALAASCSTEGRKIAFYMRKGADCLSKWVGEAERQLRLLFEEAKANQPSIIFFDEIDGLAPVRSAKQDQIHASIVSTMLALMDGMDARGQVVVIGATNRPDSVDPALRRPGRFDREFYFPLPALQARKHILHIHTSQWDPPLTTDFKNQLALQTKGYGGADLRALCTEAALNAVQRRYPQIYASTEKLVIDPSTINVAPRDFMLAIQKIVPSSARSNASGAAVLPQHLQPLLAASLLEVTNFINEVVPRTSKKTALEENATSTGDNSTFEQENMLQMLEHMRTYRPRILVAGRLGLGQQHIGRAILHHLEGFHVQTLDLAMMFSDSASTAEASLIQAFVEARRHKPSVLFLPEVELLFATASGGFISTLKSLLSTISANEPLVLIGIASNDLVELDPAIVGLFGHGSDSHVELKLPEKEQRRQFFSFLASVIRKSPADMSGAPISAPRELEVLPIAPPAPPRELTKAERKAIETKDRKTKLILKAKLGPLMELIKTRYKRFKKPIIDEKDIAHLLVASDEDVPHDLGDRDYENTDDGMILEKSTGKTFYNMDINLIEERLWSNLYLTPKQFQTDIEQILHDAKQEDGDRERTLKAQEMHTNVLIHLEEMFDTSFIDECKAMAFREVNRHRHYLEETQRQQQEKLAAEASTTTQNHAQLSNHNGPAAQDSVVTDATGALKSTSDDILDDISVSEAVQPSHAAVNVVSTTMPSDVLMHDSPMDAFSATNPAVAQEQHVERMPLEHTTSAHSSDDQERLLPKSSEAHSATVNSTDGEPSSVVTSTDISSAFESAAKIDHHHPYVLNESALDSMEQQWTTTTSGLTVDELEQVNSAAINAVWSARYDWNRDNVALAADAAIQKIARTLLGR